MGNKTAATIEALSVAFDDTNNVVTISGLDADVGHSELVLKVVDGNSSAVIISIPSNKITFAGSDPDVATIAYNDLKAAIEGVNWSNLSLSMHDHDELRASYENNSTTINNVGAGIAHISYEVLARPNVVTIGSSSVEGLTASQTYAIVETGTDVFKAIKGSWNGNTFTPNYGPVEVTGLSATQVTSIYDATGTVEQGMYEPPRPNVVTIGTSDVEGLTASQTYAIVETGTDVFKAIKGTWSSGTFTPAYPVVEVTGLTATQVTDIYDATGTVEEGMYDPLQKSFDIRINNLAVGDENILEITGNNISSFDQTLGVHIDFAYDGVSNYFDFINIDRNTGSLTIINGANSTFSLTASQFENFLSSNSRNISSKITSVEARYDANEEYDSFHQTNGVIINGDLDVVGQTSASEIIVERDQNGDLKVSVINEDGGPLYTESQLDAMQLKLFEITGDGVHNPIGGILDFHDESGNGDGSIDFQADAVNIDDSYSSGISGIGVFRDFNSSGTVDKDEGYFDGTLVSWVPNAKEIVTDIDFISIEVTNDIVEVHVHDLAPESYDPQKFQIDLDFSTTDVHNASATGDTTNGKIFLDLSTYSGNGTLEKITVQYDFSGNIDTNLATPIGDTDLIGYYEVI